MKVIKRVEPPTPVWAGLYMCPRCSSVIEVENTDRQSVRFVSDFSNRRVDSLVLMCPVCKHELTMDRAKPEGEQ